MIGRSVLVYNCFISFNGDNSFFNWIGNESKVGLRLIKKSGVCILILI